MNTLITTAMTPTKKQIAEVTAEAALQNKPVEKCLEMLKMSSASMYKSMGAKGIVRSVNYKRQCDDIYTKSTENYKSGLSGKSSL